MRGKPPLQIGFVGMVDVETLIAAYHPTRAIRVTPGYPTKEFVSGARELGIELHPTRNDREATLHVLLHLAHAARQEVLKRIEESFRWSKTTASAKSVIMGLSGLTPKGN